MPPHIPPSAPVRLFRFGRRLLITATGLAVLIVLSGWILRPNPLKKPLTFLPDQLEAVRALRDTHFDRERLPTVQREVDYSQGTAAPWYPRQESPLLAEVVREGKLPPVEQRVGEEPLVLEGPDGIGNYGGTWVRAASSPSDVSIVNWRLACTGLTRWSPLGYPIRPNIAKSWIVSPDQREWTFRLRKGMKWSDGAPFTADDILFYWEEDKALNAARPTWMLVNGKAGEIVKVDDLTVKFVFSDPNGLMLENLAKNPCITPRHYFAQYLPASGNQELIRASMKARGLATPRALYNSLKDFRNPEQPQIWPWVYRTYQNSPPEEFVRNPYFWAVDPQGRQLPYVDRILFEVKNPKLIAIAAASGEITMQERHLSFSDYTLLMENREKNHYAVYHWFDSTASEWSLWPNLNRRVTPGDPESKWKAHFLNEDRFRQALSLAINRREIIRSMYNGIGEPSQLEPGPLSDFHSEKLKNSFIAFDPDGANRLLDAVGLDRRDAEGQRTFPDGSRMTWFMDFTDYTGEGPAQFVVDDWARVGVRAIQRERSRPLFVSEKAALLHDFTVWSGEGEFAPMVSPRSFVASETESHFAPANGTWFLKGGLYGSPAAAFGGIAPPVGGPIREAMELYQQAVRAPTLPERQAIFGKIFDLDAAHLFTISIVTSPPGLVVVKDGFRNVPHNAILGASFDTPAGTGIETYFWDHPQDSPAAIAQIKAEMTTITPPPDAVNVKTLRSVGGGLGAFISKIILAIVAAGIVLAGVRHPYIGRRLLIMVPTLLLISVVTFVIIQLPPGDYVSTRILELQATGDQNAIDQVEQLRSVFHLDEPVLSQYARWMGLRWFGTFNPADKGLLQGDMGRSMETLRSVNDIVGDRVLLTFLVSLGTILITWILALPIGIYSAVRQYTPGDYVLTFLGFIGMCVPNFLLAIVLMYWSNRYLGINVSGLFSPEYSASPEWSWGKLVDLSKHVWLPVVVIATSGTAGMIRVMRGNLLDELRKPYVTTAMAKGVRPFKLLMKYPVRLALNPFISGIGGIFPALVSGGAIVAIVLSLPMVGPILLQGLMTEDIYLAGSMLMVLSLLGVFGTLVSDLLLLWLDPRIRMGGGSK